VNVPSYGKLKLPLVPGSDDLCLAEIVMYSL
jgi:hypothetical protein